MQKMLRFGIIALAVLALSGTAGAAQMAFGTFSFANSGSVGFTDTPSGNTLGSTTTQIVLPTQTITGLDNQYLGQTNSFCNSTECLAPGPDPNGQLHTTQSLLFLGGTNTINIASGLGSMIDFQFSSGTTPADRYEFVAMSPGQVTAFSFGGSSFLFITYDGNFTDSTGFFLGQSAVVSFTFTQASPGAAVGESASFSTPAVPEPASMALIGGGLVLISLLARRKRKV